jgi:hypothetical protein
VGETGGLVPCEVRGEEVGDDLIEVRLLLRRLLLVLLLLVLRLLLLLKLLLLELLLLELLLLLLLQLLLLLLSLLLLLHRHLLLVHLLPSLPLASVRNHPVRHHLRRHLPSRLDAHLANVLLQRRQLLRVQLSRQALEWGRRRGGSGGGAPSGRHGREGGGRRMWLMRRRSCGPRVSPAPPRTGTQLHSPYTQSKVASSRDSSEMEGVGRTHLHAVSSSQLHASSPPYVRPSIQSPKCPV